MDPSVKALTQFPSVLDNMSKNLSWTSALGEAYSTQAQDVMTAVQTLRAQAYAAGNLKSDRSDAVTFSAEFAQLPDGTNHVASTLINGVSKQLTVNEQNSNYQKM